MALTFGKPYARVNQIDWYATLWTGATLLYTGCTLWDCRDWYEFI